MKKGDETPENIKKKGKKMAPKLRKECRAIYMYIFNY